MQKIIENVLAFRFKVTWLNTILFAVSSAALCALLGIVPFLEGTAFHQILVTPEFWFIPALLIVLNAKSSKEAVLHTFLYFLISQPMIYLFLVPFSSMGFKLFGFYGYWFRITLLTAPAAWLAYSVKDKNRLLTVAVYAIAVGGIAYGCMYAIRNFGISSYFYSLFLFVLLFLVLRKVFAERKPVLATFVLGCLAGIGIFTYEYDLRAVKQGISLSREYEWTIVDDGGAECTLNGANLEITYTNPGDYEMVLENQYHDELTLMIHEADRTIYQYDETMEFAALDTEVQNVTSTSCTLILTDRYPEHLTYRNFYYLQKEEEGSWESIDLIGDNPLEGNTIPVDENNRAVLEIDWSVCYGTLEPGSYRIVTYAGNYPVCAQFEVK